MRAAKAYVDIRGISRISLILARMRSAFSGIIVFSTSKEAEELFKLAKAVSDDLASISGCRNLKSTPLR
jgi:hypothetical protein